MRWLHDNTLYLLYCQECMDQSDFRAQQCAAFNDWSRHHKKHVQGVSPNAEWIPKYDGIPETVLFVFNNQ